MKTAARSKKSLTKSDWVIFAKNTLIKRGIKDVKVDVLAKGLGIARGSFYWHFQNRQELLDTLLEHWQDSNTTPMLEAIHKAGENGLVEDFIHVDNLWMEERNYNPHYDSAVREWARVDENVAEIVHKVDRVRINALNDMFSSYGFNSDKALIRARILYFHQVGYYALNIKESMQERRQLSPLYDEVLLN